jgi:hypothetical protein
LLWAAFGRRSASHCTHREVLQTVDPSLLLQVKNKFSKLVMCLADRTAVIHAVAADPTAQAALTWSSYDEQKLTASLQAHVLFPNQ